MTECLFFADRTGGELGTSFNITSSVLELSLYEDLDKPYITGTLVVQDDKALFERVGLFGTERFKMTLCDADDGLNPIFERTMIAVSTNKTMKSNQNAKSSVYSFNLVDEHLFESRVRPISKSFNGRIDKVIGNLVLDNMGIDLDLSYLVLSTGDRVEAIQSNIKGIFPNITPLKAISWLLDRATTDTGSPYFCYASIHDKNLRLANLDVLLQQKAWNSKLPYTFNPSNVSVAEGQTEFERGFTIKDINVTGKNDTFAMLERGNISSEMSNTNLNTGKISKNKFKFENTLNKLAIRGIIDLEQENVYDPDFTLKGEKVVETPSKRFHTVTSSGTYGNAKSYHDENDPSKFVSKIEKRAIRNHLAKNTMDVYVNGSAFFISKASVGDIVNLKVINDDADINIFSSEDSLLDKRKSGDFLIFRTRHTFTGTQHTVAMTVCKMENDK